MKREQLELRERSAKARAEINKEALMFWLDLCTKAVFHGNALERERERGEKEKEERVGEGVYTYGKG